VNSYDRGDQVRLSLTTQVGGAATDPTLLKLLIKDPAGALTTLTYGVDVLIVKDSVGHYRYDLTLPQSGVWAYRWEATGAVVGAEERTFRVERGAFG
jgi:hypothetical protein